ncbi:glycolate oxidase subunit GlcF [Candidimonas nitroreducens]|uniref:Glycolate oxidase iron-sulfur subunit n=1 Tax=Candidimonas nitroreducens TaxID=683354 RepID=A0A225M4D5_9BURK|nr:glycolate oxidase subunit GlcF [Candidimonas nitroreducens]OWT56195.1 glycolate oxidase iron-sulfur subunit [Candidimonas nitroreducens]
MQTIIPTERLEQGRKVADTCVHFGFCTSVCPTYVLDHEENDSPRGRIALIKDMLAEGGKPPAATVLHVDRCLSCLSCATTCAAGVDYRSLIDTAREYIEQSGVRPLSERLKRKALSYIMTHPRLLSVATRAAHVAGGAAARLPGTLGTLARLSNARAVGAFAARGLGPDEGIRAGSLNAGKVTLLDGCVQSALGREINDAARRLLGRMGIEVVDSGLAGRCCGALDLHLGHRGAAQRHAARLVDTWHTLLEQGEIEAIVVTTSGCGSVIRHYSELFQDDPPRRERAARVEQACVDITQFLNARAQDLPLTSPIPARVAYHDSCSLKHGQKITREPRAVLGRAGFVVADIAENHLCCGSAGTYNILQPEIAARLGQRKAGNIEAVRPDIIAAGNMGCLVQISLYTDIPVAHTVQLLDWAAGGPPPRGMESFTPAAQPADEHAEDPLHNGAASAVPETSDLLW